jgi:hypothetical protein
MTVPPAIVLGGFTSFMPLLLLFAAPGPSDGGRSILPAAQTPVVVGLDHIPVAVNDLERAAERFRALDERNLP